MWWFPGLLVRGVEAEMRAAASVAAVVGLDGQGNPEFPGLGVIVGREGQILTSAALFPTGQEGVVKTAAGSFEIIHSLLYADALQDLALIQIKATTAPPVPLGSAEGLRPQEKVWLPVKEGDSYRLQESQVTGIFSFSPRLTLVKLMTADMEKVPGTPIFNRQGELVGMLHLFTIPSRKSESLKIYLSWGKGYLPCNLSLKKENKRNDGRPVNTAENPTPGRQLTFWEGVAASQRQSWPEAQEKFTATLASLGNLPEAYYGRGVARYHQGDLAGAVQDLEEASRGLSGYALAFMWLGKAWERRGNRKAARENYEKAVQVAPDFSEAWYHLGKLAYLEGHLSQAKECLGKASEDIPHAAIRWWYFGNIARSQNRPLEALEAFDRAIKLDDKFSAAYLEGGKLLLSVGKPQDATRLLTRAVNLEPRRPLTRYYLALAHLLSWNPAGAWEQYFVLQDLQPELAASLAAALERNR